MADGNDGTVDNLLVRLATQANKEDILHIRTAFGGSDYLPAYLDYFLADPRRKCVVCEQDGALVSCL